jgi:hypothetical protein
MGSPTIPTKPWPNLERRSERCRLQEQLWTAAYELLVPMLRRSVSPAGERTGSASGWKRSEGHQRQAVGG